MSDTSKGLKTSQPLKGAGNKMKDTNDHEVVASSIQDEWSFFPRRDGSFEVMIISII